MPTIQFKDIIVDSCIMCLYDKPKEQCLLELFCWIRSEGTLRVGKGLLREYGGTNNKLVFALLDELHRGGRLKPINKDDVNNFKEDNHFKYTCNKKDREHARVVFLSCRKKLVSLDKKLVNDINRFKKVNSIKPSACSYPDNSFYN